MVKKKIPTRAKRIMFLGTYRIIDGKKYQKGLSVTSAVNGIAGELDITLKRVAKSKRKEGFSVRIIRGRTEQAIYFRKL